MVFIDQLPLKPSLRLYDHVVTVRTAVRYFRQELMDECEEDPQVDRAAMQDTVSGEGLLGSIGHRQRVYIHHK